MICTTVISSIDTTLAIFTIEEEKEEIVAFKTYLNLAIANFAATDTSPTPTRVPLHSRPNKGNRNECSKGKSKEINLSKIVVATPRIASNQDPNSGTSKDIELPRIEARETILKAGNGLFLSGAKLEPATNWAPILISTVPSKIRLEQGQVDVDNTMLADEIERVCSVRPAHLKLYGRNETSPPHRTWMTYFTKAPRGGFRAFDESEIARPFKK
ncbi:putative eka-like protein [Erysiphe necator]|uniref:Putative eka-like protein n=1 Tax=Uncinula necator TaxID=52586 RepID=A0A0B1PBD0_UNCNE|nr:putative eka-like protein [Erysiphe necator]